MNVYVYTPIDNACVCAYVCVYIYTHTHEYMYICYVVVA